MRIAARADESVLLYGTFELAHAGHALGRIDASEPEHRLGYLRTASATSS
jgi:hypothetical protein